LMCLEVKSWWSFLRYIRKNQLSQIYQHSEHTLATKELLQTQDTFLS